MLTHGHCETIILHRMYRYREKAVGHISVYAEVYLNQRLLSDLVHILTPRLFKIHPSGQTTVFVAYIFAVII
jgi:hypothetical protein